MVGEGHGRVVYFFTTLVVYDAATDAADALSCLCLCEELATDAKEALEYTGAEVLYENAAVGLTVGAG